MQWHYKEYVLDTCRERLDFETIIRWLNTTYWAATRPGELIRKSWDNSAYVYGVYLGNEIVGWARVVSDTVTFAYLADVFIVPEHRGDGLGTWMVKTIVNRPETLQFKWYLATSDAHTLYGKFGFGVPSDRVMTRFTAPILDENAPCS